jgi:hypothetical protein
LLAVPGIKHRALRCDPVDIGRSKTHHTAIVATGIEPTDIISHNNQDIWLFLGDEIAAQKNKGETHKE